MDENVVIIRKASRRYRDPCGIICYQCTKLPDGFLCYIKYCCSGFPKGYERYISVSARPLMYLESWCKSKQTYYCEILTQG